MRSHICSTFNIFLILWRGIEPPLAQSGKSDEQRDDKGNSQTYEGYKTKTVEIIFPQILKDAGYPEGSAAGHIAWLIRRLKEAETFPHEIGLFLGYPAVDVRGFIRQEECKCTGLWKVYGSDPYQAQRTFARCRRCTKAYLQRRKEGWDLSRLAIRPGQFSYSEAERLERKETT